MTREGHARANEAQQKAAFWAHPPLSPVHIWGVGIPQSDLTNDLGRSYGVLQQLNSFVTDEWTTIPPQLEEITPMVALAKRLGGEAWCPAAQSSPIHFSVPQRGALL